MNSNTWLVTVLVVIIGVLAWFVIAPPAFVQNIIGMATTTTDGTENGGTNGGSTGVSTPSELEERVVILAPEPGDRVFKNFTVTGKAPGPWYFEASFPIEVRSAAGAVVATGHATALSDWMTTDDVAFKAEITVPSYTGAATLVLMRDNASGLPEHDASISIPITIEAQ